MFSLKNFSRLSKEGFWIVLGQMSNLIFTLVGVRVLTELLPADKYGELALAITIALLVNQIIFGPIGAGISRFYSPAYEYNDLHSYYLALKKLILFAVIVILGLSFILIMCLHIIGHAKWVWISVGAVVFSILNGVSSIIISVLMAMRKRVIISLYQGLDPLLRLVISVGLIFFFGADSAIAMMGYVIALTVLVSLQVSLVYKYIPTCDLLLLKENHWEKKIFNYSYPMGIWGMFTWMQLSSDRWALQTFSTSESVGNYAVSYQ